MLSICECKKPGIVTDDTYCFKCHKPTKKAAIKLRKAPKNTYTECPECNQKTIRAKELHEGGGIVCMNDKCNYWFCA